MASFKLALRGIYVAAAGRRATSSRGTRRKSALAQAAGAVALSAFVICAAPASAFDFDRPLDRGGSIADHMQRIVESAGRPHVISGDCMSACTMWLGHKNTCVTPDAVLWFHAASDRSREMLDDNPWRTISVSGNETMLAMYPPRVRAVVRPWLQSPDFHTLTGRELAALGVPLCRTAAAGSARAD